MKTALGVPILPLERHLQGNAPMSETDLSRAALKALFKEVLAETLREERVLLREIVGEVLEDLAIAETLHEAEQARNVKYDDVLPNLEGLA